MRVSRFYKLVLTLCLLATVSACSESNASFEELSEAVTPYQYAIPAMKSDGWQVGHLNDHGINEIAITELIEDIRKGRHQGIDSISIVRNDTLLLHEDFRKELSIYDSWIGNSILDRHVMHSTSKSFVSALVGIAKDQGYIQELNEPILNFFNYNQYDNWDERKEQVTLQNVLTMQLGIEWDEWSYPYTDNRNSLHNLTQNSEDIVKALLDLPMVHEPGTTYTYNTAASIALGAIVETSVGQNLEDFAEQFLFQPMQIENTDWVYTANGLPNTGSGLFIHTRDMAKFGVLYLNQGLWNGMQIISSEWINESLEKSVDLSWDYTSGYGYQWWIGEFIDQNQMTEFYSTRGFGGQFIIIVPAYDLVVAFTAHNYENDLYTLPFQLMEQFVLPSINQLN